MPYKKLGARRLNAISGPRSKKPAIRKQNKELVVLIAEETKTFETLVADASIRLAFLRGSGAPVDLLSIWTDFDLTSLFTELDPKHLKRWQELSEWMKLQLGFLVGLSLGGEAFSAHIHGDLLDRWTSEGKSVSALVQQRLKRELDKSGLGKLDYCYIIETRSKWGKSKTAPHLHGFILSDNPLYYTRFKLAVQRALLSGDRRRTSRKLTIKMDNLHDRLGAGRFVSYMAKNVHRWDMRIKGRSVYMSRPFTQTVREFWSLITDEPLR